MAEVLLHEQTGKYVVRLGVMPVSTGGAILVDPSSPPRLFCGWSGRVKLFELYEDAKRVAAAH